MPRKREIEPLEKATVMLFKGDYLRLQELHGVRIGASKVIRTLVRAHIDNVEAKLEQDRPAPINLEINLE